MHSLPCCIVSAFGDTLFKGFSLFCTPWVKSEVLPTDPLMGGHNATSLAGAICLGIAQWIRFQVNRNGVEIASRLSTWQIAFTQRHSTPGCSVSFGDFRKTVKARSVSPLEQPKLSKNSPFPREITDLSDFTHTIGTTIEGIVCPSSSCLTTVVRDLHLVRCSRCFVNPPIDFRVEPDIFLMIEKKTFSNRLVRCAGVYFGTIPGNRSSDWREGYSGMLVTLTVSKRAIVFRVNFILFQIEKNIGGSNTKMTVKPWPNGMQVFLKNCTDLHRLVSGFARAL